MFVAVTTDFVCFGVSRVGCLNARLAMVWLAAAAGSDQLLWSDRAVSNRAHCRVVQCRFARIFVDKIVLTTRVGRVARAYGVGELCV